MSALVTPPSPAVSARTTRVPLMPGSAFNPVW
jgi:hypothetical protein